MDSENAKQAFHEMIREKNRLKQRSRGFIEGVEASDSSMSGSGSDSELEDDLSETALKHRAISKIERLVDSEGGSDS